MMKPAKETSCGDPRPYRMRPFSIAPPVFTRDGQKVALLNDGSVRVGVGTKQPPILPAGSPEHHGRILLNRAPMLDAADFREAVRLLPEVDRLHESEIGQPGIFLLRLMSKDA